MERSGASSGTEGVKFSPCLGGLIMPKKINHRDTEIVEVSVEMKKFVSLRIMLVLCSIFVSSAFVASCGRQPARNSQTDALFRATREGNTDMVRSLVSAPGADVNATDERGSTPLLEAARYGHDDIARILIAAGADLNVKDNDGKTALMLAVQGNHDEVVRVLKQAGETD